MHKQILPWWHGTMLPCFGTDVSQMKMTMANDLSSRFFFFKVEKKLLTRKGSIFSKIFPKLWELIKLTCE